MTSIETTSRNAVASRTRLPDPATAPAIPGLSVRAFRDRTDYAHLADLEGTANLADGIPYLPTAGSLEVEMENSDGATSTDDIVLVEVDGRPVAAAGVRARRPRDPPIRGLGHGRAGLRRRGLGTWLMAWTIDHARARAEREDPGERVELAAFAEDSSAGHTRPARRDGLRAGPPLLPDAQPRSRRRPRGAAAGGVRAPARRRGRSPADHRGRERSLPRPLRPPRDDGEHLHPDVRPARARYRSVGRGVGRRRDRRGRPELDLAGGERAPRRQARLARAHQRPPAVAPARPGPGHHRGVTRSVSGTQVSRTRCWASIRRTRTARSGCTRASASRRPAAPPPTGATSRADGRPARLTTAPVVASWSHRGGGCDHAVLPDRGQRDPGG